MISGFSNERVSYRTRYLNFPSTLTENVPTINKPTVHVIKIRFNNIFKNEKTLFATIAISLSMLSLLIGIGLYSIYKDVVAEDIIAAPNSVAMEELQAISAEDAGISVMNKSTLGSGGISDSQQGGNYLSYNNGTDPNIGLIASGNSNDKAAEKGKEVLNSKKAVVDIEDKMIVNPFLPINEAVTVKPKTVAKPNPNYILPPTSVAVDSTAKLLLSTSVAGIMYDQYSPSAIIKINNTDYLVKRGDVINGYQILGIKPKTVTIKLDSNIYEAPVGIILSSLPTSNNTSTVNINNRFGGNTAGQARSKTR